MPRVPRSALLIAVGPLLVGATPSLGQKRVLVSRAGKAVAALPDLHGPCGDSTTTFDPPSPQPSVVCADPSTYPVKRVPIRCGGRITIRLGVAAREIANATLFRSSGGRPVDEPPLPKPQRLTSRRWYLEIPKRLERLTRLNFDVTYTEGGGPINYEAGIVLRGCRR